MRERPILFSGPMVKAILEGWKTQTRRICKLPDDAHDVEYWAPPSGRSEIGYADPGVNYWTYEPSGNHIDPCPYGQVGDRLWVRETWKQVPLLPYHRVRYRADTVGQVEKGWKPSIFMPRWASRITLEITGIRVQRVQEINEGDAEAEGMDGHCPEDKMTWLTPREQFSILWDSINRKRKTDYTTNLKTVYPYSWAGNPWVWVIEFKKLEEREG